MKTSSPQGPKVTKLIRHFSFVSSVFVVDLRRSQRLLNRSIARRANAQLLALIQANISAAFSEHTCRSNSGADGCAHCGANSTPDNHTDDCANTPARAAFLHVAFSY